MGAEFQIGAEITDVTDHGGRIARMRDANGRTYEAESIAITAGPWTRRLLPELKIPITPTAARLHYLAPADPPSFSHPRFVLFAVLDKLYYGFPVHWNGALKVADEEIRPEFDLDADREGDDPIALAKLRNFLRTHVPGLTNAAVMKSKICTY